MESTYKLRIKNSQINIKKDKRFLLSFPHKHLLDCSIEETEDESIFIFDISEQSKLSEALDLKLKDKYRLLYNVGELNTISDKYIVDISPDNLVYDVNLIPSLLFRDKARADEEDSFLPRYKALVAYVLKPNLGFEDYYVGGNEFYIKYKELKQLAAIESTKDLRAWLLSMYKSLEEYINNKTRSISIRNYKLIKVFMPVMLGIAVLSLAYSLYLYKHDFVFKDRIIKAHELYLSMDYVKLEESLQNIKLDRLPTESKYILARAYVSTEGLTPKQRENVLSAMSLNIDSHVYDFWILIGRLKFADAIDMAKRLGDKEMLLFAYIKEFNYLKADLSKSGEEKASRISELEKLIEEMKKTTENVNQ